MSRDKISGQFLKTKKGTKTRKMLEVEKRLSRIEGRKITLQQDYKDKYLKGDFGQKKLADRWHVARGQIFKAGRGGRQSWIDILSLPKKNAENVKHGAPSSVSRLCELCNDDAPLQKAHWIPNSKGGPNKAWNLIKLCGSCHSKFDLRGNKELGLKILKTILKREIIKIITNEKQESYQKDKIYELYKKLIADGKKYRKF
tara:strand:- start:28 stop:627 length:600 start_codon:yes stop_codon:yes gene_type:complete